ncbi:MAG: serine/threonine protein kinase, partial [Kofleriaceae bacterium]|nr:serine/threonine protein kinase [Kofleriaceae bacterium]
MSCLGENTVTDLLDAVLSPEQRAGVEAHTSTCDHCRRLVSELLRRSAELATGTPPPVAAPARTLEPGTSIGRYVVREQIGTGATGAVFTAFDPELDRVIALKVLHPGTGAQRERILREARALAKVSHPNVVAAYDIVELEGDLVLAMELVEGTDLRSVTTAGRSMRDVLDAYVQAGRGLAAAHAGGLVHRDFKPANALIGSDGRVRLVDFGLAARGGGTELVGTPAYLAPELFEGAAAEQASDQFAFCVALFEALHGDRPFVANFVDEVARGSSVSVAPGRPQVPARVRDVLARGLRADPRERFPSMAALLAALAPPRRPARTWLAVGGVATLAGAAAIVLALSRAPSPESPCRDSAAAFASVWNPARAAQIHARFTASGAPFAETAWAAVDRGLSAFANRWTSAQTDACEATRVRGVQSDQILTLRAACLNRARAEVDALATLLGEADRSTIEHAVSAIDALPSLDECSNVTALLAPVPPPSGRDAAAVAQIDALLARGRALS